MRRAALLLAVLIVACGEAPAMTTTPTRSAPGSGTTVGSLPAGTVMLEATGTVEEDARGVVLCPLETTGACPGLPLSGAEAPTPGDQVRVRGPYDGVSLQPLETAPWAPKGFQPMENPCTGEANLIQPPAEVSNRVGDILDQHQAEIAQTWISDGQLVVALKGEASALAGQLREIAGVCVVTGFEYTSDQLGTKLTQEIRPLLAGRGISMVSGSTAAAPVPTIEIETDVVDSATLALLADRYGDLVQVTSFIVVLDQTVDHLPAQVPMVEGDIDIPTYPIRTTAGMAALMSSVVLRYDHGGNCLYIEDSDGSRLVIVWPFGFTAHTGDPAAVYDPAGNVVARVGVPFDIGGGEGEKMADAPPCRADRLWIADAAPAG